MWSDKTKSYLPTKYKNQFQLKLFVSSTDEKRINYEEKKNNRINQFDPKLIVESLKAEEETSKLIVRVDKLINVTFLGVMFEDDSADMFAGKFPLVSMGG